MRVHVGVQNTLEFLNNAVSPQGLEHFAVNIHRRNGLLGRVRVVCATGYRSRALRRSEYDLIFANILARPLAVMARDLARAIMPGGIAVLAGLLRRQEAYVLAAHQAQGLALERRLVIEGWSTLVLRSGNPRSGQTRGSQR